MPRVTRSRLIDAPPDDVWELVSDPYHLPRWWPRCVRVEDVREGDGRARWTKVLETERGGTVRADFRSRSRVRGQRFGWEQELGGTPFEAILNEFSLEISLEPENGGTLVTLVAEQKLRGLSRLGSPMMRRGTSQNLAQALEGLANATSAAAPGAEAGEVDRD